MVALGQGVVVRGKALAVAAPVGVEHDHPVGVGVAVDLFLERVKVALVVELLHVRAALAVGLGDERVLIGGRGPDE